MLSYYDNMSVGLDLIFIIYEEISYEISTDHEGLTKVTHMVDGSPILLKIDETYTEIDGDYIVSMQALPKGIFSGPCKDDVLITYKTLNGKAIDDIDEITHLEIEAPKEPGVYAIFTRKIV